MMTENRGKFIMKRLKRTESKDIPRAYFSAEDPDVIPEKKDLRLVLLGKTGAGKSATGNTIIDRNVFESSKQCGSETTVRMREEISVMDTPGLYHTQLNNEEVFTEIVKCLTYSTPHAFLVVIKASRFTEEEKDTVKCLKDVFEEQILKHVIFTRKDQLKNKTMEQFLHCDPSLQTLVRSCGNRFFCLDNNSASFPQFKDLISKIEAMVEENGGTHFKNDLFDETQKHNFAGRSRHKVLMMIFVIALSVILLHAVKSVVPEAKLKQKEFSDTNHY